jgi:hypothetical protein
MSIATPRNVLPDIMRSRKGIKALGTAGLKYLRNYIFLRRGQYMKRRKHLIEIGIGCAIVMIICLFSLQPISALECRVIKINPGKGIRPLSIEPDMFVISEGDCVVWVNATNRWVKIRFLGSGSTCATPTGFFTEKNCFVSGWHYTGSTMSIRLMEKGVYEYEVIVKKDEHIKIKGKVEVK